MAAAAKKPTPKPPAKAQAPLQESKKENIGASQESDFPPQELTKKGFSGNQKYQTIKSQCLAAKKLFADPEFPADFTSIEMTRFKDKKIDWKRPNV